MPGVPGGKGAQLFGIGIFVPVGTITIDLLPLQTIWPSYVVKPLRANYSQVQSTNIALMAPTVAETVPARAGPWPEALQPPRRDYFFSAEMQIVGDEALNVPLQQVVWPWSPPWRPPRANYSWVQSANISLLTTPVVAETVPARAIWSEVSLQPARLSYSWAQPSNIALQTQVVEAPPVGSAVQVLVRWAEFPKGLRSWTRVQLLEEGLPIGQSTQQRLRDPEYLRSLRSRAAVQLFEETMPFAKDEWPIPRQPRRDYNWVQATNIALTTVVVEAPPIGVAVQGLVRWADYPRGLRSWVQAQIFEEGMPVGRTVQQRLDPRVRAIYGWVQATNLALTAVVVAPPALNVWPLVRWVDYPRNLRSFTSAKLFEERMPVGRAISARLRDPEFLRSLRSRAQSKLFEERMPVGARAFRRLDDPEFLRALRTWRHSQLPLEVTAVDVTITPDFFADPDEFFPPQVLAGAPEPTYDFPVGHAIDSDYGIRKPRRGRLVIGRR